MNIQWHACLSVVNPVGNGPSLLRLLRRLSTAVVVIGMSEQVVLASSTVGWAGGVGCMCMVEQACVHGQDLSKSWAMASHAVTVQCIVGPQS